MIIGVGCVALDDVLITGTTWGAGKGRVLSRSSQLGGNSRTALTVAAGLGAPCAYLGTLSPAAEWSFVVEDFRSHGVDLSFAAYADDVHPVLSTVIVTSDGERYIAFDDSVLRRTELPGAVNVDAALAVAQVMLVDATTAPPGTLELVRRARELGIPVVVDAERQSAHGTSVTDVLALADHPVLPAAFAMDVTNTASPRQAAATLWERGCASVVVTDGMHGAYARDASMGDVVQVPAFPISARNTNGCGDAFHGAYAVGLVDGREILDRVRLANAAAAVVASRDTPDSRVPSRAEVESLLRCS